MTEKDDEDPTEEFLGLDIRYSKNVRIKNSSGDIRAKNSTGVVTNHEGGDISVLDGSDFQMLSSEVEKITVDQSRLEICDSIATRILRVTEDDSDEVLNQLRYLAEKTIDATDESTKKRRLALLYQFAEDNEKHLRRVGYSSTIAWLVDSAHWIFKNAPF